MELTGTVKAVVFRNSANGWTVLDLFDESGDEHTAVGILPTCHVGEHVTLTGEYVEHPSYGLQFKASAVQSTPPLTVNALENYLSSGLIKGVGKVTAHQIVERFGMNAFDVLQHQPERLLEIAGIGKARANTIAASFQEQYAMRDVLLALQSFGITVAQALKFYKLYGPLCLSKIQDNPYILVEEVEGVGFKTADAIATHAGIEHCSPKRLQAGIQYVLRWAYQEGHTYLPREKLIEVAANTLEVESSMLEDELDALTIDGAVYRQMLDDVEGIFLPFLYHWETDCAKRLLALTTCEPDRLFFDLPDKLHLLEAQFHIQLAPQQRQAVLCALEENMLVITGGPGTGKTTIIRFIIHVLSQSGMDFALCAPTGRAAKRMSEATGVEASTLHRLLEYGAGTEGFGRNEDNPLYYDAIIVDEMSMVDVPLMHAFLKALPTGTRLILVGDVDQLPPVGAGNVLHDIIKSGLIPVIHLDEIFRQAEQSLIVTNAHRINHGQMPIVDQMESDFLFEEQAMQESILKRVVTLCRGDDPAIATTDARKDVQVLAPMKKGMLGVYNLNVQLQMALNPSEPDKAEKIVGNTVLREGDKVMQVKNNYSLAWTRERRGEPFQSGTGVYNGDLGTVFRIDLQQQCVHVLFDDERLAVYDFTQLDELSLAYCISIHKSQGSEFPIVLLPLFSGPPLLMTRNLLYTAVTRACKEVYLIGRQSTISQMVLNPQTRKRYSALSYFLDQLRPLFPSRGDKWPS